MGPVLNAMILLKRSNSIVVTIFTAIFLLPVIGSFAQGEMKVNLFFFKKAPFPNSHFIAGDLLIFEDRIAFKPSELKELVKDIEINCADIKTASLIFPFRIKIILETGEVYQIHTFKRKKIMKQICKRNNLIKNE